MSKKLSNHSNVPFFTESSIKILENEVEKVINDLNARSISVDQARISLQQAERSVHTLFWRITTLINRYRTFVESYQQYTETIGYPSSSTLSQSANPAARKLVQAFNDFRSGRIAVKAWQQIAGACRHALRSETRAMRNELDSYLAAAKRTEIVTLDTATDPDYNYMDISEDIDTSAYRVQSKD
jgi:septation ring formation regulator EzrA